MSGPLSSSEYRVRTPRFLRLSCPMEPLNPEELRNVRRTAASSGRLNVPPVFASSLNLPSAVA